MSTGRPPSKPEVQNIPLRTELGRQVRKAFEPKEPILLTVDYTELELRLLAQIQQQEEKKKPR
jgi:DNA polymerase-1